MGSGKVVSVIGAVIDVEFPREEVPQVYDASNWSYDPKHHDPRGRMISVGLKLTM